MSIVLFDQRRRSRAASRVSAALAVVGAVFVAAAVADVTPAKPADAPATRAAQSNAIPTAAELRRFAAEVDVQLAAELDNWYPRAVNQDDGFHSAFALDWSRRPSSGMSLVFQSRMTWTAAAAARALPDKAEQYRHWASHGVRCLSTTFWDAQSGGFFWERRPGGTIGDEKHAYGVAFGIYAAAEAHAAGDPDALELATRAFEWLDRVAHDKKNGGYFEALARDGLPLLTPTERAGAIHAFDALAIPYGHKSMNGHIHLMEAFNTLYLQSKNPKVLARLEELFYIVRNRIYFEPGCLNQLFTLDWQPLPSLDSYGHAVEAAFLLLETAHTLGLADDARTTATAQKLVDHALAVGWDDVHGGFFDEGPAFRPAENFTRVHARKIWWVQAEGLNALLLMHELHGRKTSRYWQAAMKQWNFIQRHQTDPQHGGWFGEVSQDGKTKVGASKGHDWKAAYHTGRALLLTRERLQRLQRRAAMP